jgi:phosphoglycolate phosphatase-like HAD superfamily hydrolase
VNVKAVLFDLDGTIFDIIDRDALARCLALNELGYEVSADEVRKHFRHGLGRMGVIAELGIELNDSESAEYINRSFDNFMKREAVDLTKMRKGAHCVLSALSRKFKLILVTSRSAFLSTEEELKRFNIRKFFAEIVTREVAARYHGEGVIPLLPFQEQRTKLYECAVGLTKIAPQDMLCVGDSVEELEPAKTLGMRTIGVLGGMGSKAEMERASIQTIEDLPALLSLVIDE